MLYESALRSVPAQPFLLRDRPSQGNVELKMLNVESMPAGETPFLVRDNSGSYRTFIDDLREFIASRLDRVDPYRESKEYCRQQEKASRLYERLREMLPGEGQALLLQYSDALAAAHYLETALLAEKAFLDGVRMMIRAITDEDNVEF